MIFDAATDGKHVILIMLIAGLIFLVVIGLGELTRTMSHRRHDRKRTLRPSSAAWPRLPTCAPGSPSSSARASSSASGPRSTPTSR